MVFKSIKLRIVKGRKLLTFPTVKLLQEHDDDIRALKEAVFNNEGSNDSSTDTQSPTTYNLSFTVDDGTNPVEGATVTIDGVNKTTGSDGGCTFNDMSSGVYTVEVSKEGYVTKTESITVDESHISFTISLTSSTDTQSPTTRNLSFTVNNGTNPVEGATVTIGEITGTTGSAGGCTLSNVPEGSQTVTVTCDGFTNYSDTINVSEENTSFTISLTAV